MLSVLLVGAGGFFGAISRFLISSWVRTQFVHPFPVGTFVINLTGCLGIGYLMAAFKGHEQFPTIQLLFTVGFLGAFTTFSTFSFETIELYRSGQLRLAAGYVFLSLVTCLLGVILGEKLA